MGVLYKGLHFFFKIQITGYHYSKDEYILSLIEFFNQGRLPLIKQDKLLTY